MKILILGHSGHGSTTFAKMLLRHYPEYTAADMKATIPYKKHPRLFEELLERHEVVIGIASAELLESALRSELFDLLYWVDASDRLGVPDGADLTLESARGHRERSRKGLPMLRVDNNGSHPNDMYVDSILWQEGGQNVHRNL